MSKSKSFMSRHVALMLKDVKPEWKKLFLSSSMKPKLMKALKGIEKRLRSMGVGETEIATDGLGTYIRPAPENIFRAFTFFDLDDTRAIIVGQDPYTRPEQACGLSFSVPANVKTPPSLRNIYKCLIRQGIISSQPDHGDLTAWAKQGVLMLNRFLTRNPDISKTSYGRVRTTGPGKSVAKNLHPFWEDFTSEIVRYIIYRAYKKDHYVGLMLWGNHAQAIMSNIQKETNQGIIVPLTWGHPSPMSSANRDVNNPRNFIYCPHFLHVNEELLNHGQSPINWNPDLEKDVEDEQVSAAVDMLDDEMRELLDIPKLNPIVAFTDGGCHGNGKAHAKASYGVYFPDSFIDVPNKISTRISGLVNPHPMVRISRWDTKKKILPSNNRGELLAIIYAIGKFLQMGYKRPFIIITDSKYCQGIINDWIWKWKLKDPDFEQKKNSDMLRILYQQLTRLAAVVPSKNLLHPNAASSCKSNQFDLTWQGLTVVWQGSHLKKDPPKSSEVTTGGYDYEKKIGNDEADRLCNIALDTYNDYNIHQLDSSMDD